MVERIQSSIPAKTARFFAVTALILASCSPGDNQTSENAPSEEPAFTDPVATPIVGLSSEAAIPGMEIAPGAEQRIAEIVPISSQPYYEAFLTYGDFGGAPVESLVPFGIKTGETTVDFLFVPKTVTPENEPLRGERLAMRTGFEWLFLTKGTFTNADGVEFTTWQIKPQGFGEPVTILWYKADPTQRGIIGFTDIDADRKSGRGFETPWAKVSPAIQKIIDGETKATAIPAERDLNPVYETGTITKEIMGVQISYNLITDASLDPVITQISINPNFRNYKGQSSEEAIAEYLARTFFKVWWTKGEIKHEGQPTEADFAAYMEDWTKAQKGEGPWEKVGFKIFANDLATAGYKQEEVTIWPMSSEETPEGIRAINEFVIAFVHESGVENVTVVSEDFRKAFGANFDGSSFYMYLGLSLNTNVAPNTAKPITGVMGTLPWYLTQNNGGQPTYFMQPEDDQLLDLISTEVGDNVYKAAIKVFPPSDEERTYNP